MAPARQTAPRNLDPARLAAAVGQLHIGEIVLVPEGSGRKVEVCVQVETMGERLQPVVSSLRPPFFMLEGSIRVNGRAHSVSGPVRQGDFGCGTSRPAAWGARLRTPPVRSGALLVEVEIRPQPRKPDDWIARKRATLGWQPAGSGPGTALRTLQPELDPEEARHGPSDYPSRIRSIRREREGDGWSILRIVYDLTPADAARSGNRLAFFALRGNQLEERVACSSRARLAPGRGRIAEAQCRVDRPGTPGAFDFEATEVAQIVLAKVTRRGTRLRRTDEFPFFSNREEDNLVELESVLDPPTRLLAKRWQGRGLTHSLSPGAPPGGGSEAGGFQVVTEAPAAERPSHGGLVDLFVAGAEVRYRNGLPFSLRLNVSNAGGQAVEDVTVEIQFSTSGSMRFRMPRTGSSDHPSRGEWSLPLRLDGHAWRSDPAGAVRLGIRIDPDASIVEQGGLSNEAWLDLGGVVLERR